MLSIQLQQVDNKVDQEMTIRVLIKLHLDHCPEFGTEFERTVSLRQWSQGYSLDMDIIWLLSTEIRLLDLKLTTMWGRVTIITKVSTATLEVARVQAESRSSVENATSKSLQTKWQTRLDHLWTHDHYQTAQWSSIKIEFLRIKTLTHQQMMWSHHLLLFSQSSPMKKT